jgi:23S rRNA pseudouridine2605 synthase
MSAEDARAHADEPRTPPGERLQKYLARCGVASRRHAEILITSGAVEINGQVVRELGTRIDPDRDDVRVDGRVVRPASAHVYILLNKPTNVVTTVSDTHSRRTVLDLLPAAWRAARVYPVGRLDRDTEGLLLLTNDGELALRLMHPRYALPKEYRALVAGRPSAEAIARLRRGVFLAGEVRPTAPARVWIERSAREQTWIGIELHEGRNRQVRRMFETIGHTVLELKRVRFGPLTLAGLAPGASRLLTATELATLRRAAGLDDAAETPPLASQ